MSTTKAAAQSITETITATRTAIDQARRKLLRQQQAAKDTEQLILALEEMHNRLQTR